MKCAMKKWWYNVQGNFILILNQHYLKVNRQKYAKRQTTRNPLELDFIAVLITRIIKTPKGKGMNPIRRETISEWSEFAWKKVKRKVIIFTQLANFIFSWLKSYESYILLTLVCFVIAKSYAKLVVYTL